MSNLEKAKDILNNSEYTCVLCSDSETITSSKRGVAPLLEWYEQSMTLSEFSAADKVVGKGAAFLYILLNIGELHADVISIHALETLRQHNVKATYSVLADAIRNRDNTGFCPIETAVMDISEPVSALKAIKEKLEMMKK